MPVCHVVIADKRPQDPRTSRPSFQPDLPRSFDATWARAGRGGQPDPPPPSFLVQVLKKMGRGRRKIPFATVVTDLGGAFPTWFHKGVDLCFVPTTELYKFALREGAPPRDA